MNFFKIFFCCSLLSVHVANAMEDEYDKKIHLQHINSAEKLRNLKLQHPVLEERDWKHTSEPAYVKLPKENNFTLKVEETLKTYPIKGTWIITQDNTVTGHIELYSTYREIHIQSWLYPEYRNLGIGTQARATLYESILPFVGKRVTHINIEENPIFTPEQEKLSDKEKRSLHLKREVPTQIIEREESFNFTGIISDIMPNNYASIISQLRAGSIITGYDGSQKVSSIHFHYPAKEISEDKIKKDNLLKILKKEVEPFIMNKETREEAIKRLREISE